MSMLTQTFVTDDLEDMSFEPLPVGGYTARIKSAEVKTTATGTGEYISIQWEILDSDDEGDKYNERIVFQNLNIVNDSAMAEKIARSQLKQINKALNIVKLNDTNELIGQPCKIILKIRPAKGGYDASNDVAKVMATEDSDANSDAPWTE